MLPMGEQSVTFLRSQVQVIIFWYCKYKPPFSWALDEKTRVNLWGYFTSWPGTLLTCGSPVAIKPEAHLQERANISLNGQSLWSEAIPLRPKTKMLVCTELKTKVAIPIAAPRVSAHVTRCRRRAAAPAEQSLIEPFASPCYTNRRGNVGEKEEPDRGNQCNLFGITELRREEAWL